MSTTQNTAPTDPRVVEHRRQQYLYFMSQLKIDELPENKYPQSNAASPLTAYSQYEAPGTSEQQTGTARSRSQSDGSVSANSGFGPTLVPRRSIRRARKAPNYRELPDDDRTASPSPRKSAGERTSEGEEVEPSGISGDGSDSSVAWEPPQGSRLAVDKTAERRRSLRLRKGQKGPQHTERK
jgi:hypothetical protein